MFSHFDFCLSSIDKGLCLMAGFVYDPLGKGSSPKPLTTLPSRNTSQILLMILAQLVQVQMLNYDILCSLLCPAPNPFAGSAVAKRLKLGLKKNMLKYNISCSLLTLCAAPNPLLGQQRQKGWSPVEGNLTN